MGNSRKSGLACRQVGFTLVEVLLVMAILMILVVTMVGTIDPIALVGKGKDARRKKDLGRIRVALEEYFSDKGCYPPQTMIDDLGNQSNCNSGIFQPWLSNWPCDPDGQPYIIIISSVDTSCSRWFKILTNLENRNDADIPEGWYELGDTYHVGDGTYGVNDVNYGTSSTNVNWYDFVLDPSCEWHAEDHSDDLCYVRSPDGLCNGAPDNQCSGSNCYALNNCRVSDICKVNCCGLACN